MLKTKKYTAMVLKHAEKLKEPEYGMSRAAEELKAWVLETRQQQPPLNLKNCSFFPRCRILHDPKPLLRAPHNPASDESVAPAVPLEPAMGRISMSVRKASSNKNKRKQRHEQAANEAESEVSFMTVMVQFLMQDHGFQLQEANQIAQGAWRKKKSVYKAAPAEPMAGSDEEPCPLDVEPQDGAMMVRAAIA